MTTSVTVDVVDSFSIVVGYQEKVARANRKAQSANLGTPFSSSVVARTVKVNGKFIPEWVITTTVNGPTGKGWEFAATLAWINENTAVVRNNPFPSVELARRFEEGALPVPANKICDHCGLNRNRIDTYLVFEPKTGRIDQVGRNCLTAYTGIPLGWPDITTKLSDGEYGGGSPSTFDMRMALLAGTQVIKAYGFVPRSRADEFAPATADLVLEHVLTPTADRFLTARGKEIRANILEQEPDEDFVNETLLWAQRLGYTQTDRSDYLANVKTLANSADEWLDLRHIGTVVSMLGVYRQEVERREAKARELEARPAASKALPTAGEKILVSGKVTMVRDVSTQFGMSRLVIVDDQSYPAPSKTFTTAEWAKKVDKGDEVKLQGKVKSIQTYEGKDSIMLSHCRKVS